MGCRAFEAEAPEAKIQKKKKSDKALNLTEMDHQPNVQKQTLSESLLHRLDLEHLKS